MATLAGDGRILYRGPLCPSLKTLRVAKLGKRDAERLRDKISQLEVVAKNSSGLDSELTAWAGKLPDDLHTKLAAVGLLPAKAVKVAVPLKAFLKSHIAGRKDLKPATKIIRGHTIRNLADHFGARRDAVTITPGEADDFKQWLLGQGLAPSTVAKRLEVARSFFKAIKRKTLIAVNPFDDVNSAATGGEERQRFVTRQEIDRVIAACPDHHWRTIVALARYGGLRCPSEVLSLRWQDINWETGRMIVTSPKTEHHVGKATRFCPIFPELRPYLDEAFALAEDGAVYVIDTNHRKAAMGPGGWINSNLRTTFGKIIARAGLVQWPKLFQNLRASRETELVEKFPIQAVTSWLVHPG